MDKPPQILYVEVLIGGTAQLPCKIINPQGNALKVIEKAINKISELIDRNCFELKCHFLNSFSILLRDIFTEIIPYVFPLFLLIIHSKCSSLFIRIPKDVLCQQNY